MGNPPEKQLHYISADERVNLYKKCVTEKTAIQQKQITESLLQLMQVKPFPEITVTQLCRHAGVSRRMFYYLFSNMSGGMGTGFENGVPERFEDTLAEIARQTNAIKEDPLAGMSGLPILHTIARGIPVWMQLSVIGKAYGAMPVGLTNLGNLNCQSLALGDLIPVGGIFGGPLKKKPGMQISIISFDGECVLACYGRYTAEDEAHIQNTLDSMAKAIAAYAESE